MQFPKIIRKKNSLCYSIMMKSNRFIRYSTITIDDETKECIFKCNTCDELYEKKDEIQKHCKKHYND